LTNSVYINTFEILAILDKYLEEKDKSELSFSHKIRLDFEEDKGKIFYEYLANFINNFYFL